MFNYNIKEHKGEHIVDFIKAFSADSEYNTATQDEDYEDTYYIECYFSTEYILKVDKNGIISKVKKI